MLRGSNEVAAQPWEVHEVVECIHEAAGHLVEWDCPWSRLEVDRLDLVRAFENVQDIDSTLHRLSRLERQAGRVRKTFNDPGSGGATTFTAGTPKRWMVTAYDKPTEMLWAARKQTDLRLAHHLRETAHDLRSRGHLRTEMSIRRRPLKEREAGTTIVDLTQETTMNHIAEHYFRMAGMDTAVGGTGKVRTALQAMSNRPRPPKVSNQVLAMLWREANGLPQTAQRSLDRYRQVARDYGLTAADFVTPGRAPGATGLGQRPAGRGGGSMSLPDRRSYCTCGHLATGHRGGSQRPCREPGCACPAIQKAPQPVCVNCHHVLALHPGSIPEDLLRCTAMGCRCKEWVEPDPGRYLGTPPATVEVKRAGLDLRVTLPSPGSDHLVRLKITPTGQIEILLSPR